MDPLATKIQKQVVNRFQTGDSYPLLLLLFFMNPLCFQECGEFTRILPQPTRVFCCKMESQRNPVSATKRGTADGVAVDGLDTVPTEESSILPEWNRNPNENPSWRNEEDHGIQDPPFLHRIPMEGKKDSLHSGTGPTKTHDALQEPSFETEYQVLLRQTPVCCRAYGFSPKYLASYLYAPVKLDIHP
jgi:hypothetical protein